MGDAVASLAEGAADLAAERESVQVELAEAAAATTAAEAAVEVAEEERERRGAVFGRAALRQRLELSIESEVRVRRCTRIISHTHT